MTPAMHNAGMVSHAITLRLARRTDSGAMALMSRDFVETGLGWRYSAERIGRLISDRETSAVVACDADGTLQGFAVMQFGDEHAHLVLLCVRPRQRRRGIGRRLVDWLLESAQVAGMARVDLELRADNDAAHAFYLRLGFSETRIVPAYYASHIAARRMSRTLRWAA
jgi:ribosomal protein S18 acetylase RimI-like enzyme